MKKINRTRKRVLKRIRYRMFREALIRKISDMVIDKMYDLLIKGNKVRYGEFLQHIFGGKNE